MSAFRTVSRERWLWLLPRLAFGLFVISVGVQLWLSARAESEEARATLLSDMLWLEQSLRFNLDHDAENLAQLQAEAETSAERFEAHARPLLANNTGLTQVILVDAAGRVQQSLPAAPAIPYAETVKTAHQLGRASYSPPFRDARGNWKFILATPRHPDGSSLGVYDLRKLLQDSVPWWLAQRTHIGVLDISGAVLVSRSNLVEAAPAESHRVFFDPPGHGMVLWAAPIHTSSWPGGMFSAVALVLLALIVIWSQWALRRDMQRRIAAEHALREQYAFRQAMEDSLQTGLRARDLSGRITYVNPAFCRMVGWSAQELLGVAPPMPYWCEAWHGDAFESTQALNDRILAGQGPKQGFEIRFKRKNGEIFWAWVDEAPLVDAHGQQTGWMSSIVDITPRKQAEDLARQQEERLQASARLVAMGEMASSLAHELNQPLAAISSYTTGSLNLIDQGQAHLDEIRGVLAKTQAQAQRAGQVVRRIYEFVRRAEPKSEPCDLRELVREIVALVEPDALRQRVRIQAELPPALPRLTGDRILLGQALFNLMRNGIEAMRETVEPQRVLRISAGSDEESVTLCVRDAGCGIAPEARERLFEPFYTTKASGMGMGLNICRSIVEAHQGRLWHEQADDGGSRFCMRLPLRTDREHDE